MIKPIERKVVVPQLPTDQKAGLSALHEAVLKLAEAHNYHDDALMASLRGGVSAANNARVKYVAISVAMPADAPWLGYNLQNSWAATAGVDPPGYFMAPGGQVWSRGIVNGGGSNTALADKIPGFGPAVKRSFPAGLNVVAELRVFANGLITPLFASGTPQVSLSHTWHASPATSPTPFPAPWPIFVQHGFDRCLNLDVVASSEDTQGARGLAPLPLPIWQDTGDGRVRLDALWGLQWGKKYNVRLRLSAEV